MPSREQMDAVVREIEAWQGGLEVLRIEDKPGVPAPEGRRFLFWDELNEDYREDVLASEIDWEGFTEGQKDNVIRRVIDGQDAEFWMDGIEPDGPGVYREEAARREGLIGRIGEAIGSVAWDAMTRVERAALLERAVDWDGFDAAERFDAIENILEGKDRSRWLEGIETRAERDAREDAIWAEAARRGNGSPNSEPHFRRDRIAHAAETIGELKDTEDFVILGDLRVVSESSEEPDGAYARLGGWDRLHEWDKLGVILSSDATDGLGPDDKKALLERHIDFSRVPEDVQRRWLGEVYHDATARGTAMADATEDRLLADRIAEFGEWIEGRRREAGAGWEEATEGVKLEEMYWESCSVSQGRTVPGPALLAAIERHIDYAGLPTAQRDMLEDLRDRLDAGRFGGSPAENTDGVGAALSGIVDAGFFEEALREARESTLEPWSGIPEDRKVRRIIGMALDSGAWAAWDYDGLTPGGHVLATIGREVDYAKLAPWRREGLENLRARLAAGKLDGESPISSDRGDGAGYALRMAELEADIRDEKHFGATVERPVEMPWAELTEEEKLGSIERAVRYLSLGSDPKHLDVIAREVDLARVPEARRRAFEESREEARPAPDVGTTREETPLERVERQLRDWKTDHSDLWEDGLNEAGRLRMLAGELDWTGVSPEDKAAALAREVSLDRVPEEDRRKFLGEAAREGLIVGGAAAGPPGNGEYQVWHDRGWPQSRIDQMLGGAPPARFPEDYFHAADVQADSLQEAVRLTTGKGDVLEGDHRPWDGNRGVRSYTPRPFVPRDTDAGDVIVDPRGNAHRYDGRGFRAIEAASGERTVADPVVMDDRGASDLLARVRRVSTIGERERRVTAAYDAAVAEMTRGGPGEESGLARAWQAGSERERLGLLAQLALDHGGDEELFVRRAGRAMGWPEPTAGQRQAMADAWAYAEGVGVPSPEALGTLHAEWRRDGAPRSMPDVRADVFDGLMARLEGFGDDLARLARTKEQKALAEAFGELVSDVDSSITYIAEATRQYGPPRAGVGLHPPGEEPVRLPSPGEIAAGHDGTAAVPVPGRGEDQGRPFRDYARALLDRFRGAAGRIFAREVLPPPSPGDIAEQGGPAPAPEPGRGQGRGR